MNRIHKTERGFASIAAIFLLVVMAALGGFMLTFSNTQQLTSAQDLKGSQAYWAARAGLEWGMGSVIRQASRTAACPTTDTNLTGFDGGYLREKGIHGRCKKNKNIFTHLDCK
jgi:MSHA biogenesis protein MshP